MSVCRCCLLSQRQTQSMFFMPVSRKFSNDWFFKDESAQLPQRALNQTHECRPKQYQNVIRTTLCYRFFEHCRREKPLCVQEILQVPESRSRSLNLLRFNLLKKQTMLYTLRCMRSNSLDRVKRKSSLCQKQQLRQKDLLRKRTELFLTVQSEAVPSQTKCETTARVRTIWIQRNVLSEFLFLVIYCLVVSQACLLLLPFFSGTVTSFILTKHAKRHWSARKVNSANQILQETDLSRLITRPTCYRYRAICVENKNWAAIKRRWKKTQGFQT